MIVTEEQNPRLPYLRDKTSKLTLSPGCYIMKNAQGKIIYIGKAKSLKKRVTSYFRKSADHLPKVAKMVSHVNDYDFIVTDSEFEALVLECSLIKQYKPKYNILLKDDKGYSYIRVTNEDYPRLSGELQKLDDGAEYIGPYTSSFAVRQAVDEANRVFLLPTCHRKFPQEFGKARPCLNFHIKQCMGVCRGKISKEEYRAIIDEALEYIRGGSGYSIEKLTEQMEKAAEELDFELAARLRDRIRAIEKAAESQKIIDESIKDCDCVAIVANSENACASVIKYRGGRLYDKADIFLEQTDEPNAMLTGFLMQYYSSDVDIPKHILLADSADEEDMENITRFLRDKTQHAVYMSVPQKGGLLRLTTLAKANASEYLSIRMGRTGREAAALDELAKALGMEKVPKIIECYDISNLASSDMVAGMVVFEDGRPLKKHYRRFAIKGVEGQNDYASMQEVLRRRFENYFEGEDESFKTLPDLIFLDGGKGHVNTVTPVIREMGIDVPVYGLVKDNRHRTRAVATGGGEISLSKARSAFNLVTAIQDEVHRYSVAFMTKRHKKATFASTLTSVKGVGEKKAAKLIGEFKTTEKLKAATLEEIKRTAGVNEQTAQELKRIIDEM